MYLPKRDELWLRCVLPFPRDSRIGLDCRMRSFRANDGAAEAAAVAATAAEVATEAATAAATETADAAATPTAIAPLVATIVQDVAITAETATASVLPRVPPAEVPPGAAGRSERVVPRRLGAFFLYKYSYYRFILELLASLAGCIRNEFDIIDIITINSPRLLFSRDSITHRPRWMGDDVTAHDAFSSLGDASSPHIVASPAMHRLATPTRARAPHRARMKTTTPSSRDARRLTVRRAGFDPNDPLTWNADAVDDREMGVDGVEDLGVAVENVQELSDADLAELIGANGARVPTMLDDDAFEAIREESREAETAAECVAEGRREYANGEYEKALATFARAETLEGSGPVRYRKSVVAPAGPSAGFKPRELSAGEEIAIRYNSACCHARLGNVEDGLAALKTALERGYDEYPAIRKDEEIASLREDPRFESIMARFEPQGRVGKFFDTFNGPKRGVGLLEGLKNIIDS